uniref:Ubiquitin-like-conjugating enzyme ATG10 n=1 Tax=Lepisosteus oculatus TaxID=7918 RepID=W5M1Z0_LEPOC
MSGELEKARDLYLEEAAFRLFCKQLVLHSQALGDGWVWEDMKESEDGYMKKTLLKAGPVSAPSRDCGQRSPRDEPAELELEAQEHPLLGQAFFALHPCRTQEFMSPIVTAAKGENRSLNYIAAWLSVVGPVVGLSLPLSYATAAWPSPAAPD